MSGADPVAGAALALTVAALWGLAPVLYKRVLARVSPRSLIVFFAIAVAALALAWSWAFRAEVAEDFRKMRARDWAMLAVGAAAGGFVANVLFAHLLAAHDAYWVTALAYSAPVFTAALAWTWLGERVTPRAALGVALIAAGVLLLVAGRRGRGDA